MSIYAISDLHLGISSDKPMDIFGAKWENYLDILKENWQSTIRPDDIVLIPGDISWAMYIGEAEEDFQFLNSLNGIKLISKGNHDYWWETIKKLNNYVEEKGFSTIRFLHNSVYVHDEIAICAAKGYPDNGKTEEAHSDAKELNIPMAVLVNGDSYSAAEFVAAALQEYDKAIVVGQQTCGKGYFQRPYSLGDGSYVSLSIGKYYTPKGENLEGVGITPDVVVEVSDEMYAAIYYDTIKLEEDPQLQAAIAALNK